jgi:hypothetical protein
MPFIRVRSKGGPDAEYDIGVDEATANPDLYEVIDGEPVEISRPATYPEPVKAKDPKTSVGDTLKENKS